MRARVVVFPVKGRNWCFTKSSQASLSDSTLSIHSPSTLKDLWVKISSTFASNPRPFPLISIFLSISLLIRVGLRLLARVKSEVFLRSISHLNARLVRQRLRHIAMRSCIIHKNYFYDSVTLLPFTSAFMILPLPNIPIFRVLFRTYSYWHVFQRSKKHLQLVSDGSQTTMGKEGVDNVVPVHNIKRKLKSPWVLHPTRELEELVKHSKEQDDLSKSAIFDICHTFSLNSNDFLKYRDSM